MATEERPPHRGAAPQPGAAFTAPSLSKTPTSFKTPTVSTTELRSRLRGALEHHLGADQRPLTVVGLGRRRVDILAFGFDRPEDAVLGLVVPDHYRAVGVITSSVMVRPPQRRHDQAALALGVSRTNGVVTLLATPSHGVIDTYQPQGWLIDACRRSLGLPTDPCLVAALALPMVIWLDRIMVKLLDTPCHGRLGWSDVIELCPVPARFRSRDPVDLGVTLGSSAIPWPSLRTAAAKGFPSPVAIEPDLARWMDDAMFARWCIGSFPDLGGLRADVEFLAPAEVADKIEVALRASWSAFAE